MQNGLAGHIAELDIFQGHTAFHILQNRGIFPVCGFLFCVQQSKDPLCRGKGGEKLVDHIGDLVDTCGDAVLEAGLDGFGNSVVGTYSYVDCLYVKILQRYGLLFTLALVVLMTWAMIRLWKRREYYIVLILASVAAHCVLDDLSFTVHYNTFWLALGAVLLFVMTERVNRVCGTHAV